MFLQALSLISSHLSLLDSLLSFHLKVGSMTCGSSTLPPNHGEKLKRAALCPRSDPARLGPRTIRTCTSTADMMASSANRTSLPVIWPRTLGPKCPAEEPRPVLATSILVSGMTHHFRPYYLFSFRYSLTFLFCSHLYLFR